MKDKQRVSGDIFSARGALAISTFDSARCRQMASRPRARRRGDKNIYSRLRCFQELI